MGPFWVTPRTVPGLARTASSACPTRGPSAGFLV